MPRSAILDEVDVDCAERVAQHNTFIAFLQWVADLSCLAIILIFCGGLTWQVHATSWIHWLAAVLTVMAVAAITVVSPLALVGPLVHRWRGNPATDDETSPYLLACLAAAAGTCVASGVALLVAPNHQLPSLHGTIAIWPVNRITMGGLLTAGCATGVFAAAILFAAELMHRALIRYNERRDLQWGVFVPLVTARRNAELLRRPSSDSLVRAVERARDVSQLLNRAADNLPATWPRRRRNDRFQRLQAEAYARQMASELRELSTHFSSGADEKPLTRRRTLDHAISRISSITGELAHGVPAAKRPTVSGTSHRWRDLVRRVSWHRVGYGMACIATGLVLGAVSRLLGPTIVESTATAASSAVVIVGVIIIAKAFAPDLDGVIERDALPPLRLIQRVTSPRSRREAAQKPAAQEESARHPTDG